MDASPINAAAKAVTLVRKQPTANLNPPKSSAPIANLPSPGNDSVTLSEIGKRISKQISPAADVGSFRVQGESEIAAASPVELNSQRKLSVTEDRQVILKIIDPKTKSVIRQLPAEEQVKLRKATRDMLPISNIVFL